MNGIILYWYNLIKGAVFLGALLNIRYFWQGESALLSNKEEERHAAYQEGWNLLDKYNL